MCFLVFTIVLSLLRGGYVSTMLFYCALLLPVASFAHLLFTYSSFRATQAVSSRIAVKGEEIIYTYELHNGTMLLYCPIRIRFYGDTVLFKESILSKPANWILYPKQVKKVEVAVNCKYRGNYFIGIEQISIQDYFGLFALEFHDIEKIKIMVYPQIRDILHLKMENVMSESTESIFSFDRFDASLFSDVRDYVPGDSLKSIHWKLSAKRGKWITKSFEGSVNNKSKIMMNMDPMPFTREENIILEEYLIETAVALCRYLLENNTPLELIWHTFEPHQEQGHKMKDFNRLYQALTMMGSSPGAQMMNLVQGQMAYRQMHHNFIVITPYIDAFMRDFFLRKKRQNYTINIFIIDPKSSEVTKCLERFSLEPLYELVSHGVAVYKIILENGICRLEVAG